MARSFDALEYLAMKAEKTELDAFDKEWVVKIIKKMVINVEKVLSTEWYKGRAAGEVKYISDYALRCANMDIYDRNVLKRLYDWWETLETERKHHEEVG